MQLLVIGLTESGCILVNVESSYRTELIAELLREPVVALPSPGPVPVAKVFERVVKPTRIATALSMGWFVVVT
jgi:hypothetical protein